MKNVGTADRVVRFIVGLLLLWLGYSQLAGTWMWVAYVVGVIMILVGIFSFCPLYKLFGVNTCKTCGVSGSKEGAPAQSEPSAPAQEQSAQENQPGAEMSQSQDENNQVNM